MQGASSGPIIIAPRRSKRLQSLQSQGASGGYGCGGMAGRAERAKRVEREAQGRGRGKGKQGGKAEGVLHVGGQERVERWEAKVVGQGWSGCEMDQRGCDEGRRWGCVHGCEVQYRGFREMWGRTEMDGETLKGPLHLVDR